MADTKRKMVEFIPQPTPSWIRGWPLAVSLQKTTLCQSVPLSSLPPHAHPCWFHSQPFVSSPFTGSVSVARLGPPRPLSHTQRAGLSTRFSQGEPQGLPLGAGLWFVPRKPYKLSSLRLANSRLRVSLQETTHVPVEENGFPKPIS